MKKVLITIVLLTIATEKASAQSWGTGASQIESWVREYWPIFLLVYVLVGGGVAAFKYGWGKERDYQKLITFIILNLVIVGLIGAAYSYAKSTSPL